MWCMWFHCNWKRKHEILTICASRIILVMYVIYLVTRKRHLRTHKQSEHEVKKFPCEYCDFLAFLGVLFCPWSIHGFNEAHCTGMFNCKFRSCKEGSLKQQENKPIALSYSLCRYFVHSYQDLPKRDCVCGLHQAPYLRK